MQPKLIAVELGPVGNIAESSEALEAAGYTGYWLTEHYGADRSASPLIGVAIAAGATGEHFRVGTAAVLLRHRQPVQVAAAARLLASQFPGRIDIGLASATVVGTSGGDSVLSIDDRSFERMVAATQTALVSDIAGPAAAVSPRLFLCGSSVRTAALAARLDLPYAHGPLLDDDGAALAVHRGAASHQDRSLLVRMICRATTKAAVDEAAVVSASTTIDIVGDATECAEGVRGLAIAHGVTTIAIAQLGTSAEAIHTGQILVAEAAGRELAPQP